jgi:hypothetical protein
VGGNEEKYAKAREYEVGLDLAEDQEDLALILGNIRNQAEKVSLEEENKTSQIKENHPEVIGTSLESHVF